MGSGQGAFQTADMAHRRRTSSSRGYEALKKKRGRKGKKREDTGPVWVVQLVGVLFWMGGQRVGETVRAAVVATGAGGSGSRDSNSWDGQGDLAESEADGRETAASTDEEQTADEKGVVAAAGAEAAAGEMNGEGATPAVAGRSKAESAAPGGAVADVRTAEAAAPEGAADVEKDEAAAAARAAADVHGEGRGSSTSKGSNRIVGKWV